MFVPSSVRTAFTWWLVWFRTVILLQLEDGNVWRYSGPQSVLSSPLKATHLLSIRGWRDRLQH